VIKYYMRVYEASIHQQSNSNRFGPSVYLLLTKTQFSKNFANDQSKDIGLLVGRKVSVTL
jgi:hypothetical protein